MDNGDINFCIQHGNDSVICDPVSIEEFLSEYFVRRPDAELVSSELFRMFVGMVVLLANLLLILFLNSRPSLRRKYLLFTCVAIGDAFDGGYFLFPSIIRFYSWSMGEYYQTSTQWECVIRGNMVFRIFGTEFTGVSMLALSLERVVAVRMPMFYRTYYTTKTRFLVACVGALFCLVNQIVIFLTSYLEGEATTQEDFYCGISGSVTDEFALYHQNLNIVTQVSSFLCSLMAYGYAIYTKKKYGLNTSKDIAAIKPVLVSSFIACILIISNNVVYILKNFTDIGVTKATQNIVVTWSPAIFQVYKFALYMMTSKELRVSLKRLVYDESGQSRAEVTVMPRKTSITPVMKMQGVARATVTAQTAFSTPVA